MKSGHLRTVITRRLSSFFALDGERCPDAASKALNAKMFFTRPK